jgi:hypothetical protein
MELEGLKRSMSFFENRSFLPNIIITDRHVSIQKWIREMLPDVVHYYDVWHVAKGTLI